MKLHEITSVHLTGVGGISMSAVAKLLLTAGIRVSASDLKENEQTQILADRGATIQIGESADFIPADAELLIYTSAAPTTNKERQEASRRGIPELTNFQFLGEWFSQKRVVLVTGTHGKSTTTAMLGRGLIAANLDPTVFVGSKVSDFEDGNLRLGASDLVVIEGDEYAKHFLEFKPYAVLINNIELDHTDVYPTLEDMVAAFAELLSRIQDGGIVVANLDDARVRDLIEASSSSLSSRQIRVIPFMSDDGWQIKNRQLSQSVELATASLNQPDTVNTVQTFELQSPTGEVYPINLQIPGEFNAINAMGAMVMAQVLGADLTKAISSLDSFTGIWRRFEFITSRNGVRIFSDYGHHPTAVAETLAAAHEAFPGSRIVLCFQPHHRNRTKELFFDFESSFDAADILVLCEIYEVAGRDAKADEAISSRDFLDVLSRRDAERGIERTVEYAANPQKAIDRAYALSASGDVLIVMGAGDIDAILRKNV